MSRPLTDGELLALMAGAGQRVNRAGRKRMRSEEYKEGYKAGYIAGRFGRKAPLERVLQSLKAADAAGENE